MKQLRIGVGAVTALFLLASGNASAATADQKVGFDVNSISAFVAEQIARPGGKFRLDAAMTERLRRVRAAAHLFRRVAAADTAALAKVFAPGRPQALDAILGSRWYARAPAIWRYFFRYTLTLVGRLDSGVTRVGYYNPFIDGWVLVDWKWGDNGLPGFDRAAVVAGEAMRGETVAAGQPAAWTRGRHGAIAPALKTLTRASAEAFSRRYVAKSKILPAGYKQFPRAQGDAVPLRLVAALLNLNRHYRTPALADRSRAILAAASGGGRPVAKAGISKIGTPLVDRFARLPTFIRSRLELAAYYPAEKGGFAIFAVPMVVNSVLVEYYADDHEPGRNGSGMIIVNLTDSASTIDGMKRRRPR